MRVVIEKVKNGFVVDPGWAEEQKEVFHSAGEVAERLIKLFGGLDDEKV